MVVNCEQVWREISNYLDGEVDPSLRAAMEEHICGCKRCTAVLEGTRNVIQLYGDERMSEVPLGFGQRLNRRIEDSMGSSRRGFLGWLVAAAAALLMAGSFELAKSSPVNRSPLRNEHAESGKGVPPDMMVVVASDGKIFHRNSSCPFIQDRAHLRTIPAHEAISEGYTPCVRCMKQYLAS